MKHSLITATTKNLVFDLGGVLLNLSPPRTYEAFSKLSGRTIEEIEHVAKNEREFLYYEMGQLSDVAFRNFIRTRLSIEVADATIDHAWNAMLLDLPINRLDTLQRLMGTYRTFVLSNTNSIHLKAFTKIVAEVSGGKSLENFVHRVYYSHHMGLRKPDRIIYDRLVHENALDPSQTLFFDDTFHNLGGASQVGLQTYHVTNADELFKELDSIE